MIKAESQYLEQCDIGSWHVTISTELQQKILHTLENGKVLYFPTLSFELSKEESNFLSPEIASPKSKNISYDLHTDQIKGAQPSNQNIFALKEMMKRYALQAQFFLKQLLPTYSTSSIQGRTSFRPVETSGRKSSYRKDDTRLHVDSFPANPVKGRRIFRIFTNVNPEGRPRVWRVGEPFFDVVKKMASKVRKPIPGISWILQTLNITKGNRTLYDHYMLQLHDNMKKDQSYQINAPQQEIHFAAGSSWMVFTDQVPHAAMSGQYLFEQTFYVPISALNNPTTAPLHVLETYFKQKLI